MQNLRTSAECLKGSPALQTVRDKCFEKCVTKPSSSLGSSEQQCLARCCDRYAEVSLAHRQPAQIALNRRRQAEASMTPF